jgi:hypothetical protein
VIQFLGFAPRESYAARNSTRTVMSDDKPHQFRPPLYHQNGNATNTKKGTVAGAGAEQNGWDAYRKWLSRVSKKPAAAERTPLDHSIYSWRGYHTWADKIRQTWKSEG